MSKQSTREFVAMARAAGYHVVDAQQLRPNRWLLNLLDQNGSSTLALFQSRPLVSAADVQDLAELVRLRCPARGFLIAHGGNFSPVAQRTFNELRDRRLALCTALPPAADNDEVRAGKPVLQPTNT